MAVENVEDLNAADTTMDMNVMDMNATDMNADMNVTDNSMVNETTNNSTGY